MKLDKEQSNTPILAFPEGEQSSSSSNKELYFCSPSKEAQVEYEPTIDELLERLADIIVEDYFDKNK